MCVFVTSASRPVLCFALHLGGGATGRVEGPVLERVHGGFRCPGRLPPLFPAKQPPLGNLPRKKKKKRKPPRDMRERFRIFRTWGVLKVGGISPSRPSPCHRLVQGTNLYSLPILETFRASIPLRFLIV